MNVLIVDDHATNRKLLGAQLEAEGHSVLEAADGVEALAVLECQPVDGVVSDILMPRLDGYRLCQQIRQHPKFGALPVLLYTSTYDSISDRQLAKTVGADRYIIKPAPVSVILEALQEAMQKAALRRPPQASQPDEAPVLHEYSEALVQKLENSHDRLSFLLGATPAVIWRCEPRGDFRMTFVSANVYDQFGYDAEEIIADPGFWGGHIHPDDRERVLAGLALIERQDSQAHEYRFRHKDGSWRWIRAELRVNRNGSGALVELLGFWIDVTERHHAEDALVEALCAKTEFLNNVTHELRTPLNSVIGFAGLLKDEVPGPLNAKQAAFAADILASGERLLALVEGILEMSQLDVAEAVLEREPVAISAMLDGRVAAHRKAAEARGLTLRLDVAPAAGSVELAPKALRRMLDALIDNAIKFNRDGGTVTVSARRAADALEIAVADTGIGIAREDLPKLFKPLVQLQAGLARTQGGIGLGLTLARRLAELQGGTLEVASEPGKGSTFTLRLPGGAAEKVRTIA